MKRGKYACTVCSLSSTTLWVFVNRINAATMRFGCILHLPALVATTHRLHLKERSAPYQRNKGRSRVHREQSDHSHNSAPLSTMRKTRTTTCTPRPSFNDLVRYRHHFPSSVVVQCFVSHLASTSHLHVAHMSRKEKKSVFWLCVGAG